MTNRRETAAYKHADGKKIDGRRVLVDVERARTVEGKFNTHFHVLFFNNEILIAIRLAAAQTGWWARRHSTRRSGRQRETLGQRRQRARAAALLGSRKRQGRQNGTPPRGATRRAPRRPQRRARERRPRSWKTQAVAKVLGHIVTYAPERFIFIFEIDFSREKKRPRRSEERTEPSLDGFPPATEERRKEKERDRERRRSRSRDHERRRRSRRYVIRSLCRDGLIIWFVFSREPKRSRRTEASADGAVETPAAGDERRKEHSKDKTKERRERRDRYKDK